MHPITVVKTLAVKATTSLYRNGLAPHSNLFTAEGYQSERALRSRT